jgi:hypothetical protein
MNYYDHDIVQAMMQNNVTNARDNGLITLNVLG